MTPRPRPSLLRRARNAAAAAAAIAGAWAASACGLPLSDSLNAATNTCTSSSECGEGAQCNTDGMCVSDTVNLGRVLIEIETPSLTYVDTSWAGLNGPVPSSVSLSVPRPVTFSGSLRVAGDVTGCAADDDSIPAKAELRSVLPYATLSTTYTTEVLAPKDGEGYRFQASLPPGRYDVYVTPDASWSGCAEVGAAPRFFPNVDVGSDTTFTVPYEEEVMTGQATIATGGSGAPIGWMMELVEPKYGLVVSNTITLAAEGNIAPFALRYDYAKNLVLRLRRPDGKFTIHWESETLGSPDDVRLGLEELATTPINQIAYVYYDEDAPIRATVTIQSKQLFSFLGQSASFRAVTEADDEGKINVDLIPGTYQVSVAPLGSETVSTHIENWEISPTAGCCGKTFVLPPQPQIVGHVVRPDGTPFGAASIVVAPTSSPPSDLAYLNKVFSKVPTAQPLLPRQASTTAGSDGRFEIAVDEGSLDFAVRPDPSSRFPWLVIPSLLVAPSSQSPLIDLGEIPVRAPAVLQGTVASDKSVLGGARVRAYVPTSDNPEGAAVVLIGEAIAASDGTFTLFLPPELGSRPAE